MLVVYGGRPLGRYPSAAAAAAAASDPPLKPNTHTPFSPQLFANNVTKFLLSAGPQTDPKAKGIFRVDHADEAVRGMLITEHGELMWPAPRPAPPATAAGETQQQGKGKQAAAAAEVLPPVEEDPRRAFIRRAAFGTAGAGGLVALGVMGPADMVRLVGWLVGWVAGGMCICDDRPCSVLIVSTPPIPPQHTATYTNQPHHMHVESIPRHDRPLRTCSTPSRSPPSWATTLCRASRTRSTPRS